MRKPLVLVMVCSLAVLSFADEGPDAGTPLRKWRVSVGGLGRTIENVTIHTGTRSSTDLVPKGGGGSSDGSAGSADRYDNHEYDNGFVRTDPSTHLNGDTWYWGYQDASQIQNNQLVFSGYGGMHTEYDRDTTIDTDAKSLDTDDTLFGPMVQVDYFIGEKKGVAYGLFIGGSFLTYSDSGTASTFHDEQKWTTYDEWVTDRYDLLGMVPPAAPYSGTYDGPGPLLPNTPASRTTRREKVDSDVIKAWNCIYESLDFDLTTFSLGVGVEKRFAKVLAAAAVGPTLNLVSIDATRNEKLLMSKNNGPETLLHTWTDDCCETQWKGGAFAQAGLSASLTERLHATVLARYDWTDDVEADLGPSKIEMDLSGFSIIGALGWDI